MIVLNLICVQYFMAITKTISSKRTKLNENLVLGRENCLQTTAGSLTTQLEESWTGVRDDLPVSTPHMPCSSTQGASMASQPSHSCEVLSSAKERENLIAQFFGSNKVVHSY